MNSMEPAVATAARMATLEADGFPPSDAWRAATPVRFAWDWRGESADEQRATRVRLLWNPEHLALEFRASYRALTMFSDADPNGRRDHLWDRDVAEAFLQPPDCDPRRYKEFEASPNGFWIDLDIGPGECNNLRSGLRCRALIDEKRHTWTAEMVLPMKCLTPNFDPAQSWRANFFRAEGAREPRFYSAWRPTGTPQPNFHVPAAFGALRFAK